MRGRESWESEPFWILVNLGLSLFDGRCRAAPSIILLFWILLFLAGFVRGSAWPFPTGNRVRVRRDAPGGPVAGAPDSAVPIPALLGWLVCPPRRRGLLAVRSLDKQKAEYDLL